MFSYSFFSFTFFFKLAFWLVAFLLEVAVATMGGLEASFFSRKYSVCKCFTEYFAFPFWESVCAVYHCGFLLQW